MTDPFVCPFLLRHARSLVDNDEGWSRFVGDPVASVSERFPLTWSGRAKSGEGGRPSPVSSRPFGLRGLREMGSPRLRTFRYCHVRQLTVDEDGGELPSILDKLDWTTVSSGDGDEGPDKDYSWENVPDDPKK